MLLLSFDKKVSNQKFSLESYVVDVVVGVLDKNLILYVQIKSLGKKIKNWKKWNRNAKITFSHIWIWVMNSFIIIGIKSST